MGTPGWQWEGKWLGRVGIRPEAHRKSLNPASLALFLVPGSHDWTLEPHLSLRGVL